MDYILHRKYTTQLLVMQDTHIRYVSYVCLNAHHATYLPWLKTMAGNTVALRLTPFRFDSSQKQLLTSLVDILYFVGVRWESGLLERLNGRIYKRR